MATDLLMEVVLEAVIVLVPGYLCFRVFMYLQSGNVFLPRWMERVCLFVKDMTRNKFPQITPFNEQCPMCRYPLRNGLVTNCNHAMCGTCLYARWDRRCRRHVRCPVCRHKLLEITPLHSYDYVYRLRRPGRNGLLYDFLHRYNKTHSRSVFVRLRATIHPYVSPAISTVSRLYADTWLSSRYCAMYFVMQAARFYYRCVDDMINDEGPLGYLDDAVVTVLLGKLLHAFWFT